MVLGAMLTMYANSVYDQQDTAAVPRDKGVQPTNKGPNTAEDALVDDLPVVQAASLHQQTLQEAPADVTDE